MTKRFLPRRSELVETECKCPFCGKKHMKKVNWTGRGTPRIACPKHSPMFRETDRGDLNYWADSHHGLFDREEKK